MVRGRADTILSRAHARAIGLTGGGMAGSIFVTVGTTSFDNLVALIDSQPFAALLQAQGYTALTVQFGGSALVWHHFAPALSARARGAALHRPRGA